MTLTGTNSYLAELDGEVWVIDPGPSDPNHLDALASAVYRLGRPGGVALTHGHGDHSEGVEGLLDRLGRPPLLRFEIAGKDVGPEGAITVSRPGEADSRGRVSAAGGHAPLMALHTPGHAADHLVFTVGDVLFSGDLILGGSSTIVPPGGGTLIAYLDSLRAVAALAPRMILPGHGEPIEDAVAAVEKQLAHRLARETALLDALAAGVRNRERLLDRVWADVPARLRVAAHVTMQSHLEKLDLEGRLPEDFEPEGRRHWGHR